MAAITYRGDRGLAVPGFRPLHGPKKYPGGLPSSMAAVATPLQQPPVYAPPTDCLLVTTPFVPGHRITRVIGMTFGLIVRSRGLGRNIIAGLRSIPGGEITEYTQLLEQVRHEALVRLTQHARQLGANAVISVGFDASDMSDIMTEILAYGTAVVVEPDTGPTQSVALR